MRTTGREGLNEFEDEIGKTIDAYLIRHPGTSWHTVLRALDEVGRAVKLAQSRELRAPTRSGELHV